MQWREIEAESKVFSSPHHELDNKIGSREDVAPTEEEQQYWKRKVLRRVFQTGFHPL